MYAYCEDDDPQDGALIIKMAWHSFPYLTSHEVKEYGHVTLNQYCVAQSREEAVDEKDKVNELGKQLARTIICQFAV